jgi:hypothetical protein
MCDICAQEHPDYKSMCAAMMVISSQLIQTPALSKACWGWVRPSPLNCKLSDVQTRSLAPE